MKIYNTFFALLAFSGIVSSCSNDENSNSIENGKRLISFSVVSEKPDLTRANLDGFDGKTAYFYWEENDQIAIYQPTADPSIATVSVTKINPDDKSMADATGYAINEDDNDQYYMGVYPAQYARDKSGYTKDVIDVTVFLKKDQHIDADHDYCVDKEAIIQVGLTHKDKMHLRMQTPCSFLVFDTSKRESTENTDLSDIIGIKVEAFLGEDDPVSYGICGEFRVHPSESGDITTGKEPTTDNTVTLSYGWMGKQNFPKGKFAMAIRPGGPSYLLITVTYENKEQDVYKVSSMAGAVNPEEQTALEFERASFHLFPQF